MQKYNLDDIAKLIYNLSELTKKADEVLSNSAIFVGGENSELHDIYNQREAVIQKLNTWITSEEGKNYILMNKNNWEKLIHPIIECDKKNLNNLKKRADEIGNQLKNIMKQKSLLIYTKEKKI